MLIPLKVYVPTDKRPWANYALMAVIITVSLVGFEDPELLCRLAGIDPDAIRLSVFRPEVNTNDLPLPVLAVTSSLLHAGWFHLVGNMLFLWIFGNAVNYKLGQIGYLGFYLAAAFVGDMAHYMIEGTPMVGASGAVNGAMGAFLVFFPRNDVTVLWVIWIRPGISTLSSGWIILCWVAWDVLCLSVGASGGTALWAHVSGFATGFILAVILALVGWVRPTPDEETLLDVLGVGQRR